jgi:1-acyl-sn-glycerol-3-phosphate acyltransferase
MPDTSTPTPRTLGAIGLSLRALRLGLHFLIFFALFLTFPLHRRYLPKLAAWWERKLLRLLGLRIEIVGRLPDRACLVVSNHVSWLDIVLLGGLMQAAFVSKAEVRRWPLIGRFAELLGTVFLPRGQFKTGDATRQVNETLAGGQPVVLFPSATTLADLVPPRFHARMFAAAIEGGHPILPVAIHYLPESRSAPAHHAWATWTGSAELAPHFLRLCRLERLNVRVTVGEPISPVGVDRRQLAQSSHAAISRALLADANAG